MHRRTFTCESLTRSGAWNYGKNVHSTGGRRNLYTRKTDCPFRAKAVCEVQLGNRWRFVLLESAHNHEARIPPETQNQERMTLVTTIRSFTESLYRMGHAMTEGVTRIEHRLDNIERHMEQPRSSRLRVRAWVAGRRDPAAGYRKPAHRRYEDA